MDNNSLDEIFSLNGGESSGDSGYNQAPAPAPKKPKIFGGSKAIIIIAVIIAIIGVFVIGFFVGNASYSGISREQKIMDEVYKIAKDYYIDDITKDDYDKLLAAGMISVLDKYTTLYYGNMSPAPTYGFSVTSDKYNNHIIDNILDGSSLVGKAQRGDRLLEARFDKSDEWMVVDHMDRKALDKVFGDSMTMDLKVRRGSEIFTITGMFKQADVSDALAVYRDTEAEGIGYIWLKSFRTDARDAFMAAKYSFENSGNNILILDLRDNPGGSTVELNTIAKCFIPNPTGKDIISKIEMRNYKTSADYADEYSYVRLGGIVSTTNGYFGNTVAKNTGKPFKMVVVANDMSASASEALIGNILHYMNPEDYILIGEDEYTYGKGIAQTDVQLKSDPNITMHITIGKYYVLGKYGTAEANEYTNIHGIGYPLDTTGITKDYSADRLDDSAIKVAISRAKELWQ